MVLICFVLSVFFLFFFCEGLIQNGGGGGQGGGLGTSGSTNQHRGMRGKNSEEVYKKMTLVHTLKKVAKLKYSYFLAFQKQL